MRGSALGRYFRDMSHRFNAVEDAERSGVDLSLIDESLGYSYEERAVHHQRALDMALEFERVGRELRERSEQPTSETVRR